MIETGFYKELETLKKQDGYPEADFGFLMNEDNDPYLFLHGECPHFAMALSRRFKYQIERVRDIDSNLIHVYCISQHRGQRVYIDVRGMTTDARTFFDEFADWVSFYDDGTLWCCDENDGYMEQVYPDSLKDWQEYSSDIGEYPDEDLLATADRIINDYPHYYDTKFLE